MTTTNKHYRCTLHIVQYNLEISYQLSYFAWLLFVRCPGRSCSQWKAKAGSMAAAIKNRLQLEVELKDVDLERILEDNGMKPSSE